MGSVAQQHKTDRQAPGSKVHAALLPVAVAILSHELVEQRPSSVHACSLRQPGHAEGWRLWRDNKRTVVQLLTRVLPFVRSSVFRLAASLGYRRKSLVTGALRLQALNPDSYPPDTPDDEPNTGQSLKSTGYLLLCDKALPSCPTAVCE